MSHYRATTTFLLLILVFGLVACGSNSSSVSTRSEVRSGTSAPQSGGREAAGSAAGGGDRAASNSRTAPGSGSGSAGLSAASGGSESRPKAARVPGDSSASFHPHPHSDSGAGATRFKTKGGDNSIQEFGRETSGSEFAQAAAALHDYLDARAAHAWAASCEYLAGGVPEQLAQLSGQSSGKNTRTGCPEIVANLSAGIPPRALREAADADAGALRVEGDRAFLLFTGAHHTDYFMPMAKEGGHWKVAAIAASALP